MDDPRNNLDELPVLTEVAKPESMTLSTPVNEVIDLRLSIVDPDPGGYDPYNSAPPVPIDKANLA